MPGSVIASALRSECLSGYILQVVYLCILWLPTCCVLLNMIYDDDLSVALACSWLLAEVPIFLILS